MRVPLSPLQSTPLQSKRFTRYQLPPQTYLLPRVWHEQSFSDTTSPSRLARSCLRREPPSHALHRSGAGSHLLSRTPQKATQLHRFSPDENQRPLFGTDRKRLGRMSACLGRECNSYTQTAPGHRETALNRSLSCFRAHSSSPRLPPPLTIP